VYYYLLSRKIIVSRFVILMAEKIPVVPFWVVNLHLEGEVGGSKVF
jgi:hypothetical protein